MLEPSPSSMSDPFIPFLMIIFIGVIIASVVWKESRGQELLERWARENSFRLLNVEECYFNRGPFFWTTAKGQVVFRVEVQDSQGRQRNGWVRCGSWIGGLLSDETEVRWE